MTREIIERKVRIELTLMAGDDEKLFNPIVKKLLGSTRFSIQFEIEHYIDSMGACAMRLFAYSNDKHVTLEQFTDIIILSLSDCLLGIY